MWAPACGRRLLRPHSPPIRWWGFLGKLSSSADVGCPFSPGCGPISYRRSPLKWSIIIAVFAHPNREKRSRDHFGERSFSAIILFFSFCFSLRRDHFVDHFGEALFCKQKVSIWIFSIFIQSHWVGTRWWPRKFTCSGGTFTLNWCIASECYERDSVSNECLRKFEYPAW